ncbi:MAG: Ig-like domain-containing protein [Bacteroidales bacterium]|nr:Ig-like domain-containing protein [Bacteroidales bacterium]
MKKYLTQSCLICTIALSAILASCTTENPPSPGPNPEPVAVTGIRLSHATASLDIGETLVLSATISPWHATNRTMTWSSSDTAIASADSNRVLALSAGSANIVVETEDGNKTDTTVITVLWPNVGQGCNRNNPGWGTSLGTVGFATNQTWTVGNQIWSDAVTATGCDKTNFYGVSNNSFNADCRSNPNFPGDLFSWCAVMRFQAELCPAPWRVPTVQDFRNLDITLGGSGYNRTDPNFIIKYVSDWGLPFSGRSYSDGTLTLQGTHTIYWTLAGAWVINASGGIGTSGTLRYHGSALRCVRDND